MTERYAYWLSQPNLPEDLARELRGIEGDEAAIRDRFWRHLEFGTGGLRGVLGAGDNRMNLFTVGRASQGLADYLSASFEHPAICIAYDTRHMSREFAERAAQVFCANGIRTYLFDDVRPTPMLSFAVRHKGAQAGVVITASHNPKEYNGYKVYGPDGGQITDRAAEAILARIEAVDLFVGVKTTNLTQNEYFATMGEETDAPYYEKVKSLAMRRDLLAEKAAALKILYAPLHGSGNIPVRRVLRELGFSQTAVVPRQELPDGDFPTAPYPNPEEPAVFGPAIELAKSAAPDLIFATDPDCDRIGVLTRGADGQFSVLTGNQMGALLCEYILSTKRELGNLPVNAAVIKTIVTSDLASAICARYDVRLAETLTGFKYIGEKVGAWEKSGLYAFQLGFEESYGYLAGDFVRDKDAVIAAALIAEMALYHKEKGRTLYEAMERLYQRYGYTCERLISIALPGQEGRQRIAEIMWDLRRNYRKVFAGEALAAAEDYKRAVRHDLARGVAMAMDLPRSDVLKFIFADGSWLVLRPSGTEPKMKLYVMAKGEGAEAAQARAEGIVGLCGFARGQ